MAIDRRILGRRGQHLVALPAPIRKHLRTAPGVTVYWRIGRRGEAVVSMKDRAGRGPERAPAECASCAAKDRELARVKAREAARDLALYGQGVTQGSLATYERVMHPHGPSANAARRLHGQWLLGGSRSARRKDKRDAARQARRRPVEAVVLPDELPSPAPPPSSDSSGGAAASGEERPQAAHE